MHRCIRGIQWLFVLAFSLSYWKGERVQKFKEFLLQNFWVIFVAVLKRCLNKKFWNFIPKRETETWNKPWSDDDGLFFFQCFNDLVTVLKKFLPRSECLIFGKCQTSYPTSLAESKLYECWRKYFHKSPLCSFLFYVSIYVLDDAIQELLNFLVIKLFLESRFNTKISLN